MLGKRLLYILVVIAGLALLAAAVIWWFFFRERVLGIPAAPPLIRATPEVTALTTLTATPPVTPNEVDSPLAAFVARNLEIPWALDFLPDRSMLFTERPGRVRLVDASGGLVSQPLLVVPDVAHTGEGGLLGIAVHPDFNRNAFVFIYYTYRDGDRTANKLVRYRKAGNT